MIPRVKIAFNLLVLSLLFFLDIRDLVYKIQWIGPYDQYAFSASSLDAFHAQPMKLAPTAQHASLVTDQRITPVLVSGFPSFLEACDNLTAVSSDAAFVLQFIGHNCRFGASNPSDLSRNYRASSIFLDTSMRVDAVAWGCCQLLLADRRPGVCHTWMVLHFLKRYHIQRPMVRDNWIVPEDSREEEELLALLRVIDVSSPMDRVVCGAGFEFDYVHEPVGTYVVTIFGCASPSRFAAAFVGHFTPQISHMIGHLQWLTADDLNLLGLHFVVRENSRSFVEITQQNPSDRSSLRLVHNEIINFSSFGFLYCVMLAIDLILLTMHFLTALEMIRLLIVPLVNKKASREEVELFRDEDYSNFFSRSLDRSPPVIVLTVVTELLSWMSILPASTIWTWGRSSYTKMQSFLTTVRLWSLLLVAFNGVWDLVVHMHERMAYEIARRTYVTPLEMILIGVATCYRLRARLFNVGNDKYGVEKQRIWDATAFVHAQTNMPMVVFANTFNEDLEFEICTSAQVLWKIYSPLVQVLVQSLVILWAYCLGKLVLFHLCFFRPFIKATIGQVRAEEAEDDSIGTTQVVAVGPGVHAAGPGAFVTAGGPNDADRMLRRRRSMTRRVLQTIPGYDFGNTPMRSVLVNHKYARLPLEELLDTPMRARSLVRDSLDMELVVGNRLLLKPSLYFDFGVFVHNGYVRTRKGFFNVLEPEIRVGHHQHLSKASRRYISGDLPGSQIG